ncbi:MAG: endonuclease, partial [Nocardioidaceae bacterium]
MSPQRTAQQRIAQTLVENHGQTFVEAAGITLRDKPSPLWRLLLLSLLLSARIDAGIAIRSVRELSRAGWRTPSAMAGSTWQQRVDALGRGGYRRYDERTSTQLG